ncbi:ferrous iron transporter B [Texcoconibacillus texcoconensis]|uniref:Ferrous iron transport protein B n=1 Tax=Texcoconibacillus texcoconensis TaxID=1095777 RepID=A0A840QRT1_9BACI|nr:ferrous iron transporter B [Texcoconibacillus texcoconensis]MBB5173997.1 ferrous iron transport protein B [Texcoconibacillus texcoconensis]
MSKQTILLIGPPNVGKSVIFNYLTGKNSDCANYVGTTVEYTVGDIMVGGQEYQLIDVPGTYTLEATNEAEQIAVDLLYGRGSISHSNGCHSKQQSKTEVNVAQVPKAIIVVLDAQNLERSLFLLNQIQAHQIPVIALLNRIDLLEKKGESIDVNKLMDKIKIPVIPSVAVEKEGLERVKEQLRTTVEQEPLGHDCLGGGKITEEEAWHRVEKITSEIKSKRESSVQQKETLGDKMIKPWPGIPLCLLILGLVFAFVVGVGMGLRQYILLPLFREILIPALVFIAEQIIPEGLFLQVLIGEYGLLVKGLEWPFTLVFPYVISFYIAFTIMEDSGYLPRLAVLLDGIFNKMGLPGSSIIPFLLGYGCGVPAIMASRSLSSYKERLIVTSLISLAIPCVAQSGALIFLLGERSLFVLVAVFAISLLVLVGAGMLLAKFIPGAFPSTIVEIPDLLPPKKDIIFRKVFIRMKEYIVDGAVPMMKIIAIASVVYETGVMNYISSFMRPLVTQWLQLPVEASTPLLLGVFRRELTVVPMIEMDLTLVQLFTGAVISLFYVPCIAIVATITREFNWKVALGILVVTILTAFLIGGIVARFGNMFVNVML